MGRNEPVRPQLLTLVDASGGTWDDLGEVLAVRFGVVTGRDPETRAPVVAEGVLEPACVRFHEIPGQQTPIDTPDRRVSWDTVIDFDGSHARPADPGSEAPYDQIEPWTARNRSTRVRDMNRRVALPSSLSRVIDAESRYAQALVLRQIDGGDVPEPEAPDVSEAPEDTPEGVTFFGPGVESGNNGGIRSFTSGVVVGGLRVNSGAAATRVRDAIKGGETDLGALARIALGQATSERRKDPPPAPPPTPPPSNFGASAGPRERPTDYVWQPGPAPAAPQGTTTRAERDALAGAPQPGKIGLLSTVFNPSWQGDPFFFGSEGTPVGTCPIRHDAQFAVSETKRGGLRLVGNEASGVKRGSKLYKGELWHDSSLANANTAFPNETGKWVPVVAIDLDIPPPGDPPPSDPGPGVIPDPGDGDKEESDNDVIDEAEGEGDKIGEGGDPRDGDDSWIPGGGGGEDDNDVTKGGGGLEEDDEDDVTKGGGGGDEGDEEKGEGGPREEDEDGNVTNPASQVRSEQKEKDKVTVGPPGATTSTNDQTRERTGVPCPNTTRPRTPTSVGGGGGTVTRPEVDPDSPDDLGDQLQPAIGIGFNPDGRGVDVLEDDLQPRTPFGFAPVTVENNQVVIGDTPIETVPGPDGTLKPTRPGDWNVANTPMPFLGEPGGPATLLGALYWMTFAMRAMQSVVNGAFGGPNHLSANMAVVHENGPGNPPAPSYLGSDWSSRGGATLPVNGSSVKLTNKLTGGDGTIVATGDAAVDVAISRSGSVIDLRDAFGVKIDGDYKFAVGPDGETLIRGGGATITELDTVPDSTQVGEGEVKLYAKDGSLWALAPGADPVQLGGGGTGTDGADGSDGADGVGVGSILTENTGEGSDVIYEIVFDNSGNVVLEA